MICERPGCGTVFCDDLADERALGGQRKRYCSPQCAKKSAPSATRARSRWLQKQKQISACGRRGKKRYPDQGRAAVDADMANYRNNVILYPYKCACGWWHLTSEPPEGYAMAQALKAALSRPRPRA
jgi:hypothetical protein